MSRFYAHLNTAKTILTSYNGEVPLSVFLKNFFSKEKKYGSKDRKSIAGLCYNYFRIGFALNGESIDEKILTGFFLCTNQTNEWLQNERPSWNEKIGAALDEKLALAKVDLGEVFPFDNHLSEGVDKVAFSKSFLIQPQVFVRIRPGKKEIVKSKLANASVDFEEINDSCLAFANGTKLEQVLEINREAVIQDVNSQKTGDLLSLADLSKGASVWDCCAASGGKSIMVYDKLDTIQLTVSDIRQSIITNLNQRFKDASIHSYLSFVTDLANSKNVLAALGNQTFDLVVCDAPCSGSGTWSRTPEQLLLYKESETTRYSNLQKNIARNASPFVKKGGYFLYITCSVFKQENEDVVEYLLKHTNLSLIEKQLLKGYNIQADTLFAALFQQL